MPKVIEVIEGQLGKPEGAFAIVAARFNETIVKALIEGAVDALRRHGVVEDQIKIVRVPGSFEIPVVAQSLAKSKKYTAVITLGCIIRGDTGHYDHVASATTSGIASASINSGIPVIFGVLTCENLEQAVHRAGGKAGNKGFEAAVTAIEMANLMKAI